MSDDELLSFVGEPDKGAALASEPERREIAPPVWRVLITDDESDVHSATTFALRNTKILGRRIEFYHAHSAEETIKMLTEVEDIAVILLDVVMETPNAGLDLVAVIRGELGNNQARIILRTGQPNQAPEIEVIRDYDINDYKLKSELTQNKLYASLTTAIRSYKQIKTIEASKQGLDLIVRASADLISKQGISEFAQGVLVQLSGLLSIKPDGLICVRKNSRDEGRPFIIAAAGTYCRLIDHPLAEMEVSQAREMLSESLDTSANVYGRDGVALYLGSTERGDMSCYVGSANGIRDVDRSMLELFCSNISICADNIDLVERFRSYAFTDQLVGLANRNALTEHITNLVEKGESKDYALAVIDIDNFAEINAALGQSYGDDLLKAIANRLTQYFTSDAIVARIAGDTFAIVSEKQNLTEDSVAAPFNDIFDVGDEKQLVSVTSGIIRLADIEGDGADVLKSASIVLKLAKNQNRGETLRYESVMLEQAKVRLGILRNLREAFESGALFLAFQPKFNLANNTISGFEALLRWRDGTGKTVYPATFIDIAEQSGLIVRLGEWVLRQAADAIKEIHQRGWGSAHVSVNMSVAQIRHHDLLPMLERVARECGVDTKFIDLEITESMGLNESEAFLGRLKAIKAMGFSLSVDDFGTGFSSLSYLQKMPIDRLKIDKSFIHTSKEKSGREIIEMIIHLGSTLDLKVLAEGVENNSELEMLKNLDCDEIQGFLYAKPMEQDQLFSWMDKNSNIYRAD